MVVRARLGNDFESQKCHNKTPLMRKATGDHLIKSTSLENTLGVLWWFLLTSDSSMPRSFLGIILEGVKVKFNISSYLLRIVICIVFLK